MVTFNSSKYPIEFLIGIVVILIVIIVSLLGVLIFLFINFYPPQHTTTTTTEEFTTPTTPTTDATPPQATTTRLDKREILQTIDRIVSRGYDIKDILQELTLDLEMRDRGESLELSGPRKLDPTSLRELRRHLPEIRLDKKHPFLSSIIKHRRDAPCRSSKLDSRRFDFNEERVKQRSDRRKKKMRDEKWGGIEKK